MAVLRFTTPAVQMKPSTATILVALMVAVVLATPTAAASSRRMLLGTCEDDCSKTYEDNVKKCIADTKLGEPPAIAPAMGGMVAMEYKPPVDTGTATMVEQAHAVRTCTASAGQRTCSISSLMLVANRLGGTGVPMTLCARCTATAITLPRCHIMAMVVGMRAASMCMVGNGAHFCMLLSSCRSMT
jgi:hypothetical protein